MDKATKSKGDVMAEKLAQLAAARANNAPSTLPVPPRPAPSVQLSGARTMPGMVAGAQALLQESKERVSVLEGQLAVFEGSLPVRKLDAKLIQASKWANRAETSFSDEEFRSLEAEIEASGGNVQPIKVRVIERKSGVKEGGVGPSYPPSESAESGQASLPKYEIVFGHRRHRACLNLGIPVLAMIEAELSERDLFEQMERENRERKNLTAWEQGRMYAHALDDGLYASASKLADAIGRDLTDVGKAISLAKLPSVVIDAIGSTQALQFRWSKPLRDALQANPEGVLEKARWFVGQGGARDPKVVFEALTTLDPKGGVGPSYPPKKSKMKTTDLGFGAKLKYADHSNFQLDFGKKKLTDDQASRLLSGLKELLSSL